MSVIWITGLSGSGKTTLGKCLKEKLYDIGKEYILLDGDELRNVLGASEFNKVNHTRETRLKLALKYGALVKMLSNKKINIIISTISMFKELYKWNRENLKNYKLIYLKVDINTLKRRDQKKIYEGYFKGKIKNVSGLDIKVDEPEDADLILNCDNLDTLYLAKKIIKDLKFNND